MKVMNRGLNKGEKDSKVYTPEIIAKRVHQIITDSGLKTDVIFEPSIGEGFIVKDFTESKIIGNDIDPKGKNFCDEFYLGDFENFKKSLLKDEVDIVISNPPFNGHKSRKLYPEVFLRKIVEEFGRDIPIVIIVPHGLRLNQKMKSKRWKWMNDNLEITSILSLPVDIFPGVLFHTEIIFFNVPNIKPHYYIEG